MQPHEFSATEAARLIARRQLSSVELVRGCLDRIAARESTVKAWAYINPEMALAEARKRDQTAPSGPLHGIPVGIKDVLDTADMPTQMGSPIYRKCRPTADAACVAALRAAGAIILGKTVTAEFAYVAPGPTANPLNPSHTPGGSSSGSAAAVADRMVPLALGTQTGGSILRPASFCGVLGFKPTFGIVNRAGLKLAAESLDTIGFLARDCDDCALLLRVSAGQRSDEPHRPAARSPTIGLCRTDLWERASPDCRQVVEGAARRLAAGGAAVAELTLPVSFDRLSAVRTTINDFERSRACAWEWQTHRHLLSPPMTACIANGIATPASEYWTAVEAAERIRIRIDEALQDFDAVLTPSASGEAPAGLASTGDSAFQAPWTLFHVPAVSIPAGKGRNGLPIGVQLVSGRFRDEHLLRVAAWAWDALRSSAAVATS